MQVSKQAVLAAVGAMIVMVGVIAFLLGRESGRHRTPAPAVAVAPYVPPPPAGAVPQLTGAAPYAMPAAPAAPAPAPVQAEAPPMPTARPRAPVAAASEPDEAAQVHEYFLKTSEIQIGPSGDPSEFANKLLTAQLNGDSSGFDQLTKGAEAALARVQAITPPAACQAYHQKLVKMMGDTVTMLGQLAPALKKGDATALNAILPAANSLQSQTTALESEAREIKKTYGI